MLGRHARKGQDTRPGGARLGTSQVVDADQALTRLLEVLPEFAATYENSLARPTESGDELLLHVLMGDLADFYMESGGQNPKLAARYWSVVEELAATGDEAVENAVWVSLVEWFAWGSDDERSALRSARPLLGPATVRIAAHYDSSFDQS